MADEKEGKKGRVKRGDFSTVVEVLGNPIRRRIIQKLSEGPDYTLRLSNELQIHQQLAQKHLKVIKEAELVDVVRQKSSKGADQNLFSLNKFYSLQIDFSPHLYNERLISFNNPGVWIDADHYMDRLEDKVQEIGEEEGGPDRITPLNEIVQVIDGELENLEKRRARLLYIRNLAMNTSHEALEELDPWKRQIVRFILDQGPATVEALSRHMKVSEDTVGRLVADLEKEELVKRVGDTVHLSEFV